MFKIISAGWDCARFIPWTLESVENQARSDWEIMICDDATPDPEQAKVIREWCDSRIAAGDHRWKYIIHDQHVGTVRNQWEGIKALNPAPDDVIVFLDLDGDKFAHNRVLDRLAEAYSDDTLVTYGSYRPVPDMGTSTMARPLPDLVVAHNTIRRYILEGNTCFNHLRTMKGRVFDAIPPKYFRWRNGKGWYEHGTDYIFMAAALELAGRRYKFISETLLLYNHANPNADYLIRPEAPACSQDALQMQPLQPLPEVRRVVKDLYLPQPERRRILRDYGRKYNLRIFIETGTNEGETPFFLRDDFDVLYTIELSQNLFDAACWRFRTLPQIRCIQGDSAVKLPEILAEIDQPALVWLDGHHSGPGTAVSETPVGKEIESLMADGRPHVILVDDARCFKGQAEHTLYPHYADYPTVEWVRDQAVSHGYDFELRDDVMRLTPAG